MKAKYRFVGKYLKNNAFLNDTKCTLAQVQPYNATFTVTLLSWPNNYSEYFFFISLDPLRWPFCHWSPFVVSRRLSCVWTSTWKLQAIFFKTLLFYTTTFEKKSKGIVIITIKQSSKILKFMAHIIWPDWWP